MGRLRDLAQVAIDAAIKADQFKKRERAAVTFQLPAQDPARPVLEKFEEESLEFLMVSSFKVEEGAEAGATVDGTTEEECPRCRRSVPLADGSELCDRCDSVMKDLG